jgi:cytochrome c
MTDLAGMSVPLHRTVLLSVALGGLMLGLPAPTPAGPAPGGEPGRGAALFEHCAACHAVAPGRHLTGPSLAGVVGRKAGSAEGFTRYSDGLTRSGLVWDDKTLDAWLTNPQQVVPGTSMRFPGLPDARQRADVIAYLKAAHGSAPRPRPAGAAWWAAGGWVAA